MGIGDYGSMTVAADPTGAVFGLWQSGTHTGVDLYSEPGALTWSEAMDADYEAGKDFYAEVFGYTYVPMGEGFDYSTAELDGQPVGGVGSVALMGGGRAVPLADLLHHGRHRGLLREGDRARRHRAERALGHPVRQDGLGPRSGRRGVRAQRATGRAELTHRSSGPP